MASYGFRDFFGIGDLIDRALGGYTYDDTTLAASVTWLRTKAQTLKAARRPWYLAVNFVNPHDVMHFNSDLPTENVQSKSHVMPIARAPADEIYSATWDDYPLPVSRHQSFDAPGRPKGQKFYQQVMDLLVGPWPDDDRRWPALRDDYFNAIRDCDLKIGALLQALRENGMEQDTIVIFTSDHGELGGSHQMRGKGTSACWQQNHLPLMICHPAFVGGRECEAITSQVDLTPTIIGLTGMEAQARARASAGLRGKDFSALLKAPDRAQIMLSYQDPAWASMTIDTRAYRSKTVEQQAAEPEKYPPNFRNRTAIRSVWDGRYRFSRFFSPVQFNTPNSLEALVANNDVEVFDRRNDPDEIDNLALDIRRNGELILALNREANRLISDEVGEDDGSALPIRNVRWHFTPSGSK